MFLRLDDTYFRAEFGPRVVVWRPLSQRKIAFQLQLNVCLCTRVNIKSNIAMAPAMIGYKKHTADTVRHHRGFHKHLSSKILPANGDVDTT